MAYYNDASNTYVNSTSPASEWFDWHPFLVQSSATEGAHHTDTPFEFAPANQLDAFGQPGPAVCPPPTPWAYGEDN